MQKDTGASVRIFNLTNGLACLGNSVDVIIPKELNRRYIVDGIFINEVKGCYPRAMLEVLRRLVGVSRPTSLYFYDLLFVVRISRIIRHADVVQIEQQTAGALLIPFIKRVLKKPVTIDCHDTFQALRVEHTSTLRRMLETFLEKLAYKNADLILTVSENEKNRLVSVGIDRRIIEIVPNGVDTKLFNKQPRKTEILGKYGLKGFLTVIFVGNMEYLPNREAVHALSSIIAPRVLSEVKDVKFLVVGKGKGDMEAPKLIFTGFVQNVQDLLSISDVGVAPLFHGSGTRLKILEYISSGLPVVSTSLGAEGLGVTDGVNIFIEDDLEAFASRIVELLRNKELSAEVGRAAREIARKYDWKEIARNLGIVLRTVAG